MDNRLANACKLRPSRLQKSLGQQQSEINHKDQYIIIMYRSEKVTSLLYGASPGARMDAILLERLYQRCLHRILNIHCVDVFKNLEVLQKAEITTIETRRSRIEYYRLLKI